MNAPAKIKVPNDLPFKPRATLKTPIVCLAVRLEALLRVRPFISKEMTRYYLNGVFIHSHKEGGAVCAATDGHRLGIRRDEEGLVREPWIVTVPREVKSPPKSVCNPWAVVTRAGPSFGHLSLVEGILDRKHDTAENAIARVDECYQRYGDVLIDGTFPDYTRIIPKAGDGDAVRAFNGQYLKSFGDHLTLRGADPVAPHLVFDNGDQNFVGVLMPVRPSGEKATQEWVAGLSYPEKSA